jgi:hypothetical protein
MVALSEEKAGETFFIGHTPRVIVFQTTRPEKTQSNSSMAQVFLKVKPTKQNIFVH